MIGENYWKPIITGIAKKYGADPNEMIETVRRESNFNPSAINRNSNNSTDYGIAQFNDYWYKDKISPQDALNNPMKALEVMAQAFSQGKQNDWYGFQNWKKNQPLIKGSQTMANTYTIQSGDTLNKIASAKGITLDEILKANPTIKNPNKIYAGSTLNLPVQPATPITDSSNFDLQIPSDIPSSDFKASITNPITQQDITDIIARSDKTRQNIVGLNKQTEEERQLGQQIADIRAQADNLNIDTIEKGVDLKNSGSMYQNEFNAKKTAIGDAAQIPLMRLGIQEKNLIARLGLAQEARKDEIQSQQLGLNADESKMNLYFKIEDRINTEKQNWLNQTDKLNDNARQTISTILSHFDGLTFEQLDQKSQMQLQNLAARAGIPTSVLAQGMTVLKNQSDLKTLQAQVQMQRTRQLMNKDAEGNTPDGKGNSVPVVKITPENSRGLLGAGFSSSEISHIQNDVSVHGLDAVIKNMKDNKANAGQIAAVEKAYGKTIISKEQVRTAAFQADPTQIAGLLRATYTDDELFQKAKEKGYARWYTGKSTDIQRFLSSRDATELYADLLYDQYKEAGMAE